MIENIVIAVFLVLVVVVFWFFWEARQPTPNKEIDDIDVGEWNLFTGPD